MKKFKFHPQTIKRLKVLLAACPPRATPKIDASAEKQLEAYNDVSKRIREEFERDPSFMRGYFG